MSADKVLALYVFCMDYHTGQHSRLYRLMSRITTLYNPKLSESCIAGIQYGSNLCWETSHEIYSQLVSKHVR